MGMCVCVCVNSYATRSDSALQQRKIKTKLQTGVAYDVKVIILRYNCNRHAVENLTFTDVPRRHVTLLSEATFERNAFHSSVFLARYCGCPQFFLSSFSFLEFLLPVVLSEGSFRALCQL